MNLEDIKEILALVREHDLAEFELERDGLKVRVRKSGRDAGVSPVAVTPAQTVPVAAPLAAASLASTVSLPVEDPGALDLAVIKSPIVGTFYRAPEPGAANFVEIGQAIKKGQVLCIIEAMKLMNEIESDADGEIAAIYVENGRPVQFGDRLFSLKVNL